MIDPVAVCTLIAVRSDVPGMSIVSHESVGMLELISMTDLSGGGFGSRWREGYTTCQWLLALVLPRKSVQGSWSSNMSYWEGSAVLMTC